MSMHNKPLTPLELAGLEAHGLDIGTPSQLSDAFRQGIAYAQSVPVPPTTVMRELHRAYHITPKGAPVDFNEDVKLPPPNGRDGKPVAGRAVHIEFDGAEGGAVWVVDRRDNEMVPIRGQQACRELARLLLAFADGYDKQEGEVAQ